VFLGTGDYIPSPETELPKPVCPGGSEPLTRDYHDRFDVR